MPTASKLVAAILFAALSFAVAELYKTTIVEKTVWGFLSEISAGIGLICGWRIMGRLTGSGYWAAMGFGVRTAITTLFWVILAFAIYVMVIQSTHMRYHDPLEALLGATGFVLDYWRSMAKPILIAAIFVGGLVIGLICEAVGRRWP